MRILRGIIPSDIPWLPQHWENGHLARSRIRESCPLAFKRDYKLILHRHLPVEKLHAVVEKLANVEVLPIPMLPMANWALELDIGNNFTIHYSLLPITCSLALGRT